MEDRDKSITDFNVHFCLMNVLKFVRFGGFPLVL